MVTVPVQSDPRLRWIAVFGGAHRFDAAQLQAAYFAGTIIAERGFGLFTGATTGVPHAAALGAMRTGGRVVGVSPAETPTDHVERFGKPLDGADPIVYTGMGLAGRSQFIARSVGGALFVGGEIGTLDEFCLSWLCGTPVLAIVEGLGGISSRLRDLLGTVETNWGSQVFFGGDVEVLTRSLCDNLERLAEGALSLKNDPPGGDVLEMLGLVDGGPKP